MEAAFSFPRRQSARRIIPMQRNGGVIAFFVSVHARLARPVQRARPGEEQNREQSFHRIGAQSERAIIVRRHTGLTGARD